MDNLDLRDWVQIVVSLIGFIVVIVTVKTDVKWIKEWCKDHKEEDEKRFEEVRKDIRDLRFNKVRHP